MVIIMDSFWNEFIKSGDVRSYLKYKKALEEEKTKEGREFKYGTGKSFGNGNKDS